MEFAQASVRRQVAWLREFARELLRPEGLHEGPFRLLNHGFNTTFRVDAPDGRRFALRVNVNSGSRLPQIQAEMAWQKALAAETELWVPVPQGELRTGYFAPLVRDLPAVLYSWLPGRTVWDEVDEGIMRAMGRMTRQLHDHAEGWAAGAKLGFRTLAQGYVMEQPNFMFKESEFLTPARVATYHAVFERLAEASARIERAQPSIPVHYDLHFSNIHRFRGRFSVFDFDDAMRAPKVHDHGVTLYYVRRHENFRPSWEAAYWEGYGVSPAIEAADLETLIAARNLLLVDDLLFTMNPELREMIPAYVQKTDARLEHYLRTGRFDGTIAD